MRLLLRLVLFAALVASVVWAVNKPGYDSVIAAVVALGALIAEFVSSRGNPPSTMSQKVGKGGKGIQAGGNITIRK